MIKSGNRDLLLYAAGVLMVVLAVSLISRSEAQEKPEAKTCPDSSLGETSEDCPWANIARQMIAEDKAGRGSSLKDQLKKLAPDLHRSLEEDATRKSWKALWGRSINFDELAQEIIVNPSIIDALSAKFGLRKPMQPIYIQAPKLGAHPALQELSAPSNKDSAGHDLVHAGLEHTYGYLLSVLKTKFGYKRARWVSGEIEKGFGLPTGLLGPQPSKGTLFANVTYFAGRIAFKGNATRMETLTQDTQSLASELTSFDFSKLKTVRLQETVTAKDSTGLSREVVLRTDFVPFLHPQKNTHLLVYSVSDPSVGEEQLITAFPVDTSFVETASITDLGKDKPVQTRYNAFVEGLSGTKIPGKRELVPAAPSSEKSQESKEKSQDKEST